MTLSYNFFIPSGLNKTYKAFGNLIGLVIIYQFNYNNLLI
jgi:hypothetical protein